jgi:hypothetical protein
MPDRYCRSVPDSTPASDHPSPQPLHGAGGPGRYLPSAQVVAELASLGPDLNRLAEELRRCLTGSADEVPSRQS